MKDHYLQTSADLQRMAIVWSVDDVLLMAMVSKEVVLGHIAEFFRTWRRMGMHERMALVQEEVGGPANIAYAVNGEAARQFDPEYWTRKKQAEDLKNAIHSDVTKRDWLPPTSLNSRGCALSLPSRRCLRTHGSTRTASSHTIDQYRSTTRADSWTSTRRASTTTN